MTVLTQLYIRNATFVNSLSMDNSCECVYDAIDL